MDNLTVSLIQAHIRWHDPSANFKTVEAHVSSCGKSDLIVLPEMWSSGFTMKAHEYYKYTEDALDLMKRWSTEKNALLIGSLITKEKEEYYNRLYVVQGSEVIETYDKKHLFAYSGEDRFFSSGSERKIVEYQGWRISLNICYDLRFPVWCRNRGDYDLSLFTANWPNKRIEAWRTLLKARAIENQSFVLGCNCYGMDAWKNQYDGYSSVSSYDGQSMGELHGEEGVVSARLHKKDLEEFRKSLPFLKDGDDFELK